MDKFKDDVKRMISFTKTQKIKSVSEAPAAPLIATFPDVEGGGQNVDYFLSRCELGPYSRHE